MAEVPIPFVDEDVDTDDDATTILMSVGVIILGLAAFAWFQDVGQYLADRVNSFITSLIGIDPTSGEDDGLGVL